MNVSQKCQYALRALFELARRQGQGPVPVGEIAEAQAIPSRFLELILGELKHAGYVESRRGAQGGYVLAVSPWDLSVGDVIRFVDGPLAPVKCLGGQREKDCPLYGNCAFMDVWERAMKAVGEVYDSTSLQELIDQQSSPRMANYCI
jgi:Rrf2 family protein